MEIKRKFTILVMVCDIKQSVHPPEMIVECVLSRELRQNYKMSYVKCFILVNNSNERLNVLYNKILTGFTTARYRC